MVSEASTSSRTSSGGPKEADAGATGVGKVVAGILLERSSLVVSPTRRRRPRAPRDMLESDTRDGRQREARGKTGLRGLRSRNRASAGRSARQRGEFGRSRQMRLAECTGT
jgi:hypothetical protein